MSSKLIGWLYIPPEERGVFWVFKFRCLTCGHRASLEEVESGPCAGCAKKERKQGAPSG